MAIATAAKTAVETINERLTPALETLQESIHDGRRAIARGRRAAEDAADAASLQIRRHPLGAVMIAASIGALAGGLAGAWLARRRK